MSDPTSEQVLDTVLAIHNNLRDTWILDGPDAVWEQLCEMDQSTKQKLLMAYVGAASRKV